MQSILVRERIALDIVPIPGKLPQQFMFRIVDRYVFIEWAKIFFLVLGAMFGLQMIVEVQDKFADLLGYDASVGDILFYFLILTPSFLTISLPAAVLVSILYSLGQLHRNNEFLAFRASGMSVFGVTKSIWFAGVLLSAGLWFLNASLIPWSVEQSRRLWNTLEWKSEAESVEEDKVGIITGLAFDNRKENRLWYINRFSEYTNYGYGITISFLDDERREVRRIMASEGYYDEIDGEWVLERVLDRYYDPEEAEVVRSPSYEKLVLEEIEDDPNLMLLFGKRPKDLSYLELKRITRNFTTEENPKVLGYLARYHALMASAASCLIVVGIAIPFAVSGVRVNPAVGVSKSIALFFGYYILASVLNALGRQEYLLPSVAAWTPNVIMIAAAYIFVRRVR